MNAQGHARWVDAFDNICEAMVMLTTARQHGAQNFDHFNSRVTQMWMLLREAPEGLLADCCVTANRLIDDYFA